MYPYVLTFTARPLSSVEMASFRLIYTYEYGELAQFTCIARAYQKDKRY